MPTSARVVLAALAPAVASALTNPSGTSDVYPVTYNFANASTTSNYSSSTCVTLTAARPVVTLDYVWEIGGFPFIEVTDVPTRGVQIESRYSEAKTNLDLPQADGPWTYSNGLSNSFRVETFNISSPGRFQSFFIQGGQRWQAFKLLGEGSFTFCGAGMASGNDIRGIEELPGNFHSSNELYNKIWALGVRSAQQACIPSGSAPSTWEIAEEGAFIRGQTPAQSSLGTEYGNYTMSFSTKIVCGGTGWRVAASIRGKGQYFVLTSEYPEGTFLNTNRTLLPPNTLVANYGWSIVNQTTLETGQNMYYPMPFDVKEGEWYNISTTINATGYTVSIHPSFVPNANSSDAAVSIFVSGDNTTGTWGFGPFQDQEAYFTNVTVEAENGTVLYKSDLKGDSILEEYGVAANTHNVCLDGAKRDRLVWMGDYTHTQRIIAVSTNSSEFSTGTLAYALEWQASNSSLYPGFSGMSASMGASPAFGTNRAGYALIDYQFGYLIAFADYYHATGDLPFLTTHYPQLKTIADSLIANLVDPSTNLISTNSIPGTFFLGPPANGTAPSAMFVYALNKTAGLALAANDTASASSWSAAAAAVAAAVNALLWNDELGTYAVSLAADDGFANSSITATAFPILAGIAPAGRAARAIAALDRLRLGIGYKADSSVDTAADQTSLSPNLCGFLLEALLKASADAAFASNNDNSTTTTNNNNNSTAATASAARKTAISLLLDRLWPAMVTDDAYATGASWEYVLGSGRPGLGPYTSHAHPWGGAPTYVLSEYVLGVRATGAGFATWAFEPSVAVSGEVGVEWVTGRVPVPKGGGVVEAGWWREDGGRRVRVRACGVVGTTGVVRVPGREGVVAVVDGGECVDVVV
ncbi:glycoside hydrolase family 78 protein [Diplodia corticola]|uniref:Glycoside hydrolase family 78 protein n=1 Tax=Diplodia corticola TaxID=236234 RepID=A0A1J9RIR7_9PEZI|nr:glycoside hydrolase family 78 protein [Diplodia corticola]OJD40544.1 glycoside hydrolase family 78 protein [Diplodia corticola]